MNVRPEVVSLLSTLDMTGVHPGTWIHQDGRPLTLAERALAESATWQEIESLLTYARNVQAHHEQRAADMRRIAELTDPYFARHPDAQTMGQIVHHMTDADRAEFMTVMDRLAPDGMVEVGE